MTVEDQVQESLRLLVVGPRLAVDEAKEPLARGSQEVVAAVVGGFGESRHKGRPLQDRGQWVTCLGAEVQDGLPRIESFHQEEIDPGVKVLSGRKRRLGNVNAEYAVSGVGVGGDVEWTVTAGNDRCVVHDRAAGDLDERAVARTRDSARREAGRRKHVRSWNERSGRGEIGLALEVDNGRSELILVGGR